MLIDRNSVELFADGGRVAMTKLFFPGEPFATASNNQTGICQLVRERAYVLNP